MSISLLNAVTSTGTGTATVLDKLLSMHTITVTWGGTAPTSVVVALEGSCDGINYGALTTETITASPTLVHVVNKPVQYIRGNYVSKTGGDGTTSVTMTVDSGVS